jgi:nitrate reductase beta subunit
MARQISMALDLNKCIGCHVCTAACKSLLTDEPSQDYMLWNNTRTKPVRDYPKTGEKTGEGGSLFCPRDLQARRGRHRVVDR